MLRLLSWNAYEEPSTPPTQMVLSAQSPPQTSSSPPSAAMKRKRPADEAGRGEICVTNYPKAKSKRQHQSLSNDGSKSTYAPAPSCSQRPEGLPTPLSSPTETKMEDIVSGPSNTYASDLYRSKSRRRRTRRVIQQQINLEILLKHNELRLIDQELAKCQTSLEQLRRCTEIPYPATRISESVSSGRGPALQRSFSGRLPSSPAPWGVVDGPYSKHYSRWLLPDPRFDGGDVEIPATVSGKRPAKGRIRGSFAEDYSAGVQSRSQRSGQLKALPAGYGQPKEKASGPLLLKRKSDGVMVKLVCPDCGRHDFGSAQGFINHCRIGHGRNFTSHDQAAESCGEPVEYDENGAMIGVEPATTPTSNFVHPLIRSARLLLSNSSPTSNTNVSNIDGTSELAATYRSARSQVSPDFRASQLTPHLSALIKDKGLGLDLQYMVTAAKIKVDFPESDDEGMEDENESPTPPERNSQHPHVAGTRKITKHSKSPQTSPLLQSRLPVTSTAFNSTATSSSFGGIGLDRMKPTQILHPESIGPSPTTESNQAPSLIDDDEDFEPHSPTSSSGSEQAEEGEVEFHVQDEDDSQQVALPRSEFQPTCAQAAGPEPPTPRVRRPSALRKQAKTREEKHVSFVSPSPGRDIPSPERKRRKIAK